MSTQLLEIAQVIRLLGPSKVTLFWSFLAKNVIRLQFHAHYSETTHYIKNILEIKYVEHEFLRKMSIKVSTKKIEIWFCRRDFLSFLHAHTCSRILLSKTLVVDSGVTRPGQLRALPELHLLSARVDNF